MVNSAFDVLLEHKQSGIPLEDCVVQAQLVGETENELECSSIQSYRRLVFDLTKEVFIDTISQHEPASQPPWTKAKWKGGQKLSRNFKRWKSDEEISRGRPGTSDERDRAGCAARNHGNDTAQDACAREQEGQR